MLSYDQFSLYESMSATEICDPKMDVKANLDSNDTVFKCLQAKTIKEPEELTIEEIIGIFDELLGKEMLWLKGNSLAQTLYTFM